MFTNKDISQFSEKGIDVSTVEQQLDYFRSGFPFLQLDRAATAGDGILQLTDSETQRLCRIYNDKLDQRKVLKFVPASGAATRMFKDLYDYLKDTQADEDQSPKVKEVFDRLQDFAFYPDLKQIMDERNISISDRKGITELILMKEGLNYGNKPKGLL